MPGFDQRGPAGQGPMTGRRMGRCTRPEETPSGDQELNPENNFPGRGFGFGWRRGRGIGRGMGRQNRFRGGC